MAEATCTISVQLQQRTARAAQHKKCGDPLLYALEMFERRVASYFHLTSWTRESVPVGTVLWPAWKESYYWSAQENVDSQAAVMALEFEPRRWHGRLDATVLATLARAKAAAQRRKELVFEEIRQREFPMCPSRTCCLFLCESEATLRRYIADYGLVTSARILLELEMVVFEDSRDMLEELGLARAAFGPLNQCRRVRVNPSFLNCNALSPTDQEEMARRYWRSDETAPDRITEVLFFGFVRVLRVLEL